MLVTDLEKRSYWRWKERKSQEVVKRGNAWFHLWLWEGFLFGSWCEKARLRQGRSLPQRGYTSELKGEHTRKGGWCQRALQKGCCHKQAPHVSAQSGHMVPPAVTYRAARSRSTPAFLVHTSSRKVTSRLRKSRQRCHGPALKNWVSKGDPGGEWMGKITSSAPGSTGKRRWKAVCQPEPRGTVLVAGVGTRWGSPWPPRRRWGDFIPL